MTSEKTTFTSPFPLGWIQKDSRAVRSFTAQLWTRCMTFQGSWKEPLAKRRCPLKCSYFSVLKMSPAVRILNSWWSRGDLDLLGVQCSLLNYRISSFFNWPGQLLYLLYSWSSCLKCQLNSWACTCWDFLFTLGNYEPLGFIHQKLKIAAWNMPQLWGGAQSTRHSSLNAL